MSESMSELFNSALFYIFISLVAYEIGLFVYKKTKISVFNSFLISVILIIVYILKTNTSLESYDKGGSIISFFLGPATVILAVPLYKQLELLKANILPILVGITTGCITSIISIIALAKIYKQNTTMILSLIPKSITTPIGIELSRQIGGVPSITVTAILITGIIGAVFGPIICKLFKIKDKIAVGVAFGTSSHAIGTSRALELGEIEGAMSGLSIGIAGIITVVLAPIIINFLN